jgi:hypothetical protein
MAGQGIVRNENATLLERLLAVLRAGGAHTLSSLAGELGTSPALVETMVADLARRGLLRERPAQCCPGQCRGCAAAGVCGLGEPGRVWEVASRQT